MAAENATTPTLEQQEPSRTKELNIITDPIKQVLIMMSNGIEPRPKLTAAGPNRDEEGKSNRPTEGHEGMKSVGDRINQFLLSMILGVTLNRSKMYNYGRHYGDQPHEKDTNVVSTCGGRTKVTTEEEQEARRNTGKPTIINNQPPDIIRKPRQPPKPPPIRPKPPWPTITTIRINTITGGNIKPNEMNRINKKNRISTSRNRIRSTNKQPRHLASRNNSGSNSTPYSISRGTLVIQERSLPKHLQVDQAQQAPKSSETCKARQRSAEIPPTRLKKPIKQEKSAKKANYPPMQYEPLHNSSHKTTTMSTTMNIDDNIDSGVAEERSGTKRSQEHSPPRVSTAMMNGKEVTPNGSNKKNDTGARPMEVEQNDSGTAKTLFELQAERLAKGKADDKEKEGEDTVEESAKTGRNKVQMTVGKAVNGGFDTRATFNFTVQMKKGSNLVETLGNALHTTVKFFDKGLGQKNVGFLPVKEDDEGTKPLTGSTLGSSGSYSMLSTYASSKDLNIPLNDPRSVKLFAVKKNGKAHVVRFTCIVAYNHLSKGEWGAIYKNLRNAGIECEIKEHPSVDSKKGLVAMRVPPKLPQNNVVEPMEKALQKVVKKWCRDNSETDVSKNIVVRINREYPPQIWDKDNSYLSETSNKRIYTIEYPTKYEELMLNVLKEWRDECRPVIGRKMFFWAKPDMDGEGLESRKVAYGTHTKQSAIAMDVLVYAELPGFQLMKPFGLDATLNLVTKDGQPLTTTAREILMGVELPSKNKKKPRFLLYALVQTENGVDAVVPKSEEYLDKLKNIAASPAGYVLFRLLTKYNVTKDSLESNIAKAFDSIAIKMAKNCAHYDEASDRITMSFGVGKDTLQTPEEREILEEDWMEQAMEASRKMAENNATENGVLYDYDDEDSDVGSVSTQVFNERNLGFDIGASYEELAQASTEDEDSSNVQAQQAGTGNDNAPPSDDVVGQNA